MCKDSLPINQEHAVHVLARKALWVFDPGGDPNKVDPNVVTVALTSSRVSDHTDLTPTNRTDSALTLWWL